MYYKQITEGFEDQKNFAIMGQVGMSDGEVRSTIKQQVFMVFFIPLAGAVLHTAAGLPFTVCLLGAIRMNQPDVIFISCVGAIVAFSFIYFISYGITARAYLRIVRTAR
jgi:putative ABC transport system permease protein